MERIDLLWDAWEDCLCKEQLRAEFDRLTVEVERLLQINQEANRNIWRLQSWLDRISAPIKGTQRSSTRGGRGCSDSDREAVDRICAYLDSQKPSEKQPKFHDAIRSNIQGLKDYRGVWHEGGIEDCPMCDPKCEHKNIGVEWESQNKRWCPDCHEWVEKPNHIHSDDSGIFWEGAEKDCPMCNPKPLTQCPECHGTKYINRVVSCADWELHPIYVIATCLNCKGEGVI